MGNYEIVFSVNALVKSKTLKSFACTKCDHKTFNEIDM